MCPEMGASSWEKKTYRNCTSYNLEVSGTGTIFPAVVAGSAELIHNACRQSPTPSPGDPPPPAMPSFSFTMSSPVPQNPRLQGYRGRGCQASIWWPWQEGGRISQPHLRQGRAEVSHPRHKAKSSATMKLAGMCHHRPIQP